jgi:hypothetical protein
MPSLSPPAPARTTVVPPGSTQPTSARLDTADPDRRSTQKSSAANSTPPSPVQPLSKAQRDSARLNGAFALAPNSASSLALARRPSHPQPERRCCPPALVENAPEPFMRDGQGARTRRPAKGEGNKNVRGSQGPPNATLSGPPGARGHEKRHPDYFNFFLGLQRGEAKGWSRGSAAAEGGRCRRGALPTRGVADEGRSEDGAALTGAATSGRTSACGSWSHAGGGARSTSGRSACHSWSWRRGP